MSSAGQVQTFDGCQFEFGCVAPDEPLLVAVRGEIDFANAAPLGDALVELLQQIETRMFALDASDVSFIDSSGLSALIRLKLGADQAALAFETVAASATFRKAVHVAGLTEFLNVRGSS
jgi:anti-sigma B factor antagonist